jgi:21S rRNA (GM2251-2'-O)-methyltransferase
MQPDPIFTQARQEMEYESGDFEKDSSPVYDTTTDAMFDGDFELPSGFPRNGRKSEINSPMQYIYGNGPVLCALQGTKRSKFTRLFTMFDAEKSKTEIIALAKARGIPIHSKVDRQRLNHLTNNGVHNGWVVETKPIRPPDLIEMGLTQESRTYSVLQRVMSQEQSLKFNVADSHNKANAFGIYIDEITDPHNMGAVIRSAYYLGADFIVISGKNCSKLTPVVAKCSVGAMEFIPIYNAPDPLDFFDRTTRNGWFTVAAMPDFAKIKPQRRTYASNLVHLLDEGPCLLVFGNEGEGLRQSLINRSTHGVALVSRPNIKIDSLNVSVAAAILMSKFYKSEIFDDVHPKTLAPI